MLAQTSLAQNQKQNILNFLNLKFGMFIHYNTCTYSDEQWAYPFHDPKNFRPMELDCGQWAKAAKSAGMQYGVLTTKHLDGFCLWNSKTTNYDIGSTEEEYRDRDIVKEYVDAFRAEGLAPAFYWSAWDRHQGVEDGKVNEFRLSFMKEQLTELLTNYGDIPFIVIDSWGSVWGGIYFEEVPFHVLADHIHSLQPNCLIINHSCRADLAYTQIVHYEATHGQHIPYDNTYPSQQGPCLQGVWFWNTGMENVELKSTESVLQELQYCNARYSNYLLNAAPNNKGLLDDHVVARLKEIGDALKLSPPLTSLPKIEPPHKNVTVKTSSTQDDPAIDGRNLLDCNLFTAWKAAESDDKPWVELDFGRPETFNHFSMHAGYDEAIQKYVIEAFVGDEWVQLYEGGPGTFHEKSDITEVTAQKYRLRVLEKAGLPEIRELTFVQY